MTLDCFILRSSSFFTNSDHPQSRVISVNSWYLASFLNPLFLSIWLCFFFPFPSFSFFLLWFYDRFPDFLSSLYPDPWIFDAVPCSVLPDSLDFWISSEMVNRLFRSFSWKSLVLKLRLWKLSVCFFPAFWLYYNAHRTIFQARILHKLPNVNSIWFVDS